eukprot:403349755
MSSLDKHSDDHQHQDENENSSKSHMLDDWFTGGDFEEFEDDDQHNHKNGNANRSQGPRSALQSKSKQDISDKNDSHSQKQTSNPRKDSPLKTSTLDKREVETNGRKNDNRRYSRDRQIDSDNKRQIPAERQDQSSRYQKNDRDRQRPDQRQDIDRRERDTREKLGDRDTHKYQHAKDTYEKSRRSPRRRSSSKKQGKIFVLNILTIHKRSQRQGIFRQKGQVNRDRDNKPQRDEQKISTNTQFTLQNDNISESELKYHFILSNLKKTDLDANPQLKDKLKQRLLESFDIVLKQLFANQVFPVSTIEYELVKPTQDQFELKIGCKYDHIAFIVFRKLNSIELPKIDGLNLRDSRLTVSKTFQSLIATSDDQLRLQAYGSKKRESTITENRDERLPYKRDIIDTKVNRSRSRDKQRTERRSNSKANDYKHHDRRNKSPDRPIQSISDDTKQRDIPKVEKPAKQSKFDQRPEDIKSQLPKNNTQLPLPKQAADQAVIQPEIAQVLVNPVVPLETQDPDSCCYIIGLPTDVKGLVIYEELKQRNIIDEVDYDILIKKDAFCLQYKYIKLIYKSSEPINKILAQASFKINDQNLLVLPEVKNVSLSEIIAHHQVILKFTNNSQKESALKLVDKSIQDLTDLRREIFNLFGFLSNFGDIVDLNLDYFPEQIIVTFTKHEVVRKLLQEKKLLYKSNSSGEQWEFGTSKIDFELPVRNCTSSSQTATNKYLPIFLQKDKFAIIQQQLP